MARLRRAQPSASLLLVVAAVAIAGALVGVEPAAAKVIERMIWERGDGEGNPLNRAAPANTAVGAYGHGVILWETAPDDPASWKFPLVRFRADLDVPDLLGEPGDWAHLGVKVTGTVHDPGDLGRGHAATPIFLLNDVWQTGVVLPGVKLNCFPLGIEPRCDRFSATGEHGSAAFQFPPITSKHDRFSVGIGLLNCGPCYVRWTYVPETVTSTPLMRNKAKFLPGRRVTVQIHSHDYDPRNLIVQWGAQIRFCNDKFVIAYPEWLLGSTGERRRIRLDPLECKVFPFTSRVSPGKGLTHQSRIGTCTRVTSTTNAQALLRIYVLPKGDTRPTKKHQRYINKCLGYAPRSDEDVKIIG